MQPARIGSFVLLRDLATGESQAFELVPAPQADPNHGRLSIDTPLGAGIHGRRRGWILELDTAAGPRNLRLDAVEHGAEW
jgi:transcription elongation GreA/GreB family factor